MSTPPLLQPGFTWAVAATHDGDDLASLAARHRAAWLPGTSTTQAQRMIAQANDVTWSTQAVDAWVFSLSGKRRKFVATSSPDGKSGWAVFGAGNEILLPVSLTAVEMDSEVISVPAERGSANHKGLWVLAAVATSAALAALFG